MQLAISASQPSPSSNKHDVCHVTLDCSPVIAVTQTIATMDGSGNDFQLTENTDVINTLYDSVKTEFSMVKYFSARPDTRFATGSRGDLMICLSAFSREFGAVQLGF
jgi:hypothetical protein